jgi:glutathione S-transferase
MPDQPDLVLYHAPNTRSTGTRILLEELGVPYRLHVVNMAAGEQRSPEFLAVNPMGKVPALRHGEALVTEQVAIFLYLADRFPDAKLAPAFDDPLRGPYLRWMVFYAACFEPAVVDRALTREPGRQAMSPYGSFDNVMETLNDQLGRGPYLLGERFSAADILWGEALGWTTGFKLVPVTAVIGAYLERAQTRASVQKVRSAEAALVAELAPPPA